MMKFSALLFIISIILKTNGLHDSGRLDPQDDSQSENVGGSLISYRALRSKDVPVGDEESVLDPKTTASLLDFAVVGFAKCGTTFLLKKLLNTNETFMGDETSNREVCNLSHDDPKALANRYWNHEPKTTNDGVRIKNGLKCPKDLIAEKSIANYENYFPNTKFVVTTRHPIWWFQSFYNFRVLGGSNIERSPEKLIGECRKGSTNVCTDRAKFHHFLSRLGKTPMNSQKEKTLLNHDMSIHDLPHAKVFLMEIGQFGVENRTRADEFVRGMQSFLELRHDLKPLKEHHSPNNELLSDAATNNLINICDPSHAILREVLKEIGLESSTWIKDYFMKSPDVTVMHPEHFLKLIDEWQHDPCEAAKDEEVTARL